MIRRHIANRMTFALAMVFLCYSADAASTAAINSTETVAQPPLVFPNDSSKYKILPKNQTIIRSLSHNNESEADGMINYMKPIDDSEFTIIPLHEEKHASYNVNPKLQSEFIQEQGAAVEKDTMPNIGFHSTVGHWSVITISSVMLVSIVAIMALYVWKKLVVRKYGSRQILINEEDPPRNSQF